jgi:hypothetical protein
MKTIAEKGWLDSKPKVYAPVPYSHMKELVERNDHDARAELDASASRSWTALIESEQYVL